jgi:hypothetical protein
LPEDADFEEMDDLLGAGHFSPYQEKLINALKADDWLGFDYPSQAISAAFSKRLDNYDPSPALREAIEGAGNKYTVDIPEDSVAKMLDWDSPVAAGKTGKQIYAELSKKVGAQKASEILKKHGIPGIKYYDGGSRTTGQGTRNFVVFDDKLPKILKRE